MLPPKYYYVHYDEATGEILGFFNPMKGKVHETPTILISAEQHAEVHGRAHNYRVLNTQLVSVSNVQEPEEAPKVDIGLALIAGFVHDDLCFALQPGALSVLQLDLATGTENVRAVINTAEGSRLKVLERAKAIEVSGLIVEHLGALYSSQRH